MMRSFIRENTANIITSIRILCSMALLFFPLFSLEFYILYLTAGFTDMIDGAVARNTNTVSVIGSKLDTVADFIFAAACMLKIFPSIKIPGWLWVWVAGIALIKLVNALYGYIAVKEFVAVHTVINKITGFMLFVLPLTFSVIDLKYSAVAVCLSATLAAIHEGYCIKSERK